MSKKILLLIGAIAIGALFTTGIAQAYILSVNTGELQYSNVALVFWYTRLDTATIRIMEGPKMLITKQVQNDRTGVLSDTEVVCERGDTITIILSTENTGDTGAYQITIWDTFTPTNATVGPAESDSFVYCAGSETATNSSGYDLPDSIAYYVSGSWQAWQAYADKSEPSPEDNITGIKWYWRHLYSDASDDVGNDKIEVRFKWFKRDN